MSVTTQAAVPARDRPPEVTGRAERPLWTALLTVLAVWLLLRLGLDAAFGLFGEAGRITALALPWVLLGVTVLRLVPIARTRAETIARTRAETIARARAETAARGPVAQRPPAHSGPAHFVPAASDHPAPPSRPDQAPARQAETFAGALAAAAPPRIGGIALRGNRLRLHVIGWSVAALILLGLWAFGGLLRPALVGMLGRSGGVIADAGGRDGLFLGAVALVIALVLLVIGSGGALTRRPGTFERSFVGNFTAKVAAVPMALVAVCVFFGGTLWTVIYSFTNSRLLPRQQWVGLEQYQRLWSEDRWLISIENLAIYGSLALVLQLVLGFLLAVLLDQKIRFENTFRTIMLYPYAMSFIVTGLVWQWILNPDFGIQRLIRSIGFESVNFDPLYNPSLVIYGILIAGIWQGAGLVMCLMLAGLRGIDGEIWKAARVDGIPAWKTYIFIIIPMMRPVFITTLVLICSGIVKLYDLVVAQTSGGPGIASEVPAKYVYDKMFLGQNLGLGFAASTMMLVTVLIILIPWAYLEFGGKKRG